MGYIENLEQDIVELERKILALSDYLGVELQKAMKTTAEMMEEFEQTQNEYPDREYYKVIKK